MIFILSCFDLAAVIIVQPVLILSTILWSMETNNVAEITLRIYVSSLFGGFSMFALLTLNIERFVALTRPFFHQTVVTKGKLTVLSTSNDHTRRSNVIVLV